MDADVEPSREHRLVRRPSSAPIGLTVYGCEPDEAAVFRAASPRFGIAPTTMPEAASAASATPVRGNRCVSVGHKHQISADTLRVLGRAGVDYLSTRSIGVDHIDMDAAADLGITIDNVAYAPDGVADYTVMLILMAIRRAGDLLRAAGRHDFRVDGPRGRDLRDLTVGVLGAGPVGRAVAQRLRGFGCRVLVYGTGRTAGALAVGSLEEVLRESDVVTLHLPLAPATHHLIGRDQLATMRRGAVLVNTGRGALVDTAALVDALERGELAGAALDVLEDEGGIFYADHSGAPLPHRHLGRLEALPNVIITPHAAYFTARTLHETVEQTLANCLRFERNRTDAQTEDRDLVRGMLRGA